MSEIALKDRDLLRLLDLDPQGLEHILEVAQKQKKDWKSNICEHPCQNKAVAIIMEKPSLRTRTSFEVGVARLGAQPIVMSDDHSAFSRGETVHDTTLVLERFVDAIVLRTFEQSKVEEVAHWAKIPVINALTDDFHPCQGLADALTIIEHKGKLEGIKLAYIGDGNNMANTYMELASLGKMDVQIICPDNYMPNKKITEECFEACKKWGGSLQIDNNPSALKSVDVIITDTWTSMGDEEEHDKRLKDFEGFQVNEALMQKCADDAIFMHCLPAHRGEEATDEVLDGSQSVIFDEAENRLHAQKALLSCLLGVA